MKIMSKHDMVNTYGKLVQTPCESHPLTMLDAKPQWVQKGLGVQHEIEDTSRKTAKEKDQEVHSLEDTVKEEIMIRLAKLGLATQLELQVANELGQKHRTRIPFNQG